MFSPDGDNFRALHIVLAAALIGYLVFCLSHAYAVWVKRQQGLTGSGRRFPWAISGVLGLILIGGTWLDQTLLVRREGVIAAEGFHVVRARPDATDVDLTALDTVHAGQVLATFRGPVITEKISAKEGEIAALGTKMRTLALSAPELDGALVQQRADARAEWQTFSSGLGVLAYAGRGKDSSEGLGTLLAQRDETSNALKRLEVLQGRGLVAEQEVEAARSRAVGAREALELSQRGRDMAAQSRDRVAAIDAAIVKDGRRASELRRTEAEEVRSKLEQAHADLAALREQVEVRAPIDGRIVFRHRAPSLAAADEPVLAVASGAGFIAHLDVPAGDVPHLRADEQLTLRLKDALVGTTVIGRFVSAAPAAQNPRRARVEIACDLPFEQFAQLSKKAIQVRLEWAPPLYASPTTWGGLLLLALSGVMFWANQRGRRAAITTQVMIENPTAHASLPSPLKALPGQMYELGLTLREELTRGRPQPQTLAAIESLMERHPVQAIIPLIEGFEDAPGEWSARTVLRQSDEATSTQLRRILQVVAPLDDEPLQLAAVSSYAHLQ